MTDEKKQELMRDIINNACNNRFDLYLNLEDYIIAMREEYPAGNMLDNKNVKNIIFNYEKGQKILRIDTKYYLLNNMQDVFIKIADLDKYVIEEILNNFYYLI